MLVRQILIVMITGIMIINCTDNDIVKGNLPDEIIDGDSLLAYWKMAPNNNILNDESGNELHGRVVGSPQSTQGLIGNALKFSGSEYIAFQVDSSLELKSFTFSLWVKRNYNRPMPLLQYAELGANGEKGYGTHLWLNSIGWGNELDGSVLFNTANAQPKVQALLDTSQFVTLNEWHHLAVTHDNNTGESNIYINGWLTEKQVRITDRIFEASNILSTVHPLTTLDSFYIGHSPGYANVNTPAYFIGEIDEVKIFNKVLSPEKILSLIKEN